MRSCSWLLILLWMLKLSVGAAMAMPSLNVPLAAAHVTSLKPATEHSIAHHPSPPDCHGHLAVSGEQTASDAPRSSEHSDKAPCAVHADCHHCCPVGWETITTMALHPAPGVHATRQAQGWQSESWRPDLRPPIA